MKIVNTIGILFCLTLSPLLSAAEPPIAELWQLLQTQQQQIEALQSELASTRSVLKQAIGKLDDTVSNVEAASAQTAAVDAKIEATAGLAGSGGDR